MKWHVQWPAFVLALVGVAFFAADRLTRTPTVVHSQSGGRAQLEIPVARDGHYYVRGEIHGEALTFMVDTGATYVSVSREFAKAARLPAGIPGYFSTANGSAEGQLLKGHDVVVEGLRVSGLTIAVAPLD
ncbi:MAG TPA: retropepsin-like aspartic protease, partial [Burkholderiales bacterium]|nr:retropepsin-like aspartic protease [Burkholderiales bacterium]